MRESRDAVGGSYERITIPTIWVAFALSVLLHAAALWGWLPKVPVLPSEDAKQGKPGGSLAVRLAPPPAPVIQARPAPAPAPRPSSPPRAEPKPPPPAPRILALERPSPSSATPPPAEAPRPPPQAVSPPPDAVRPRQDAVRPRVYEDLASLIEARRRARESVSTPPSQGSPAVALPAETEKERHNRIVAANLGLNRTPSFGAEPEPGGGIFQIERMGYNDAEFIFFGWNEFIGRNARQMIEVRRGDNATIELAVVRKMIAIIREHERGDFQWKSERLGRSLTLSARIADNAGLEEVMMREFFSDSRPR